MGWPADALTEAGRLHFLFLMVLRYHHVRYSLPRQFRFGTKTYTAMIQGVCWQFASLLEYGLKSWNLAFVSSKSVA